jgi:hypothetical protein
MSGFLVTSANVTLCPHAGKATVAPAGPRVFASGLPVVTVTDLYTVAACQFPTVTSGAPPCVTATFTMGAKGAFSMGRPIATVASASLCQPTPQPMIVAPAGQVRVVAL